MIPYIGYYINVKDETSILCITLSLFFSHNLTKAGLVEYLAKRIIEDHKDSNKFSGMHNKK